MQIRSERSADEKQIRELLLAAFQTSAEADLVDALRDEGHVDISLVAEQADQLVGHILFSRLPIMTSSETVEAISLAPMAVQPSCQRQGIGSRLVEAGLEACRAKGHKIGVVLGHPTFYSRFGFSARLAQPLETPYGGGTAWMAIELAPGALNGVAGRVVYPPPFQALE